MPFLVLFRRLAENSAAYISATSHLVTSMTAPIASGWSKIAGWVSHPLGKRRLSTAHAISGHSVVII
jgi:hypothetical protein